MEGRLLLKDCAVLRSDGRIRSGMAVLIEGGRISRVAPDAELPVLPGDWEVACRGRVVTTGLVDCHAHLVGAQLVPHSGEYLLRSPRSRFEAYEARTSQLTASEVEVLTAYGMARALRAGTTMVVEHLSCPREVGAALQAQAAAALRLGIRLVTSHATHALRATESVPQVEENLEFARKYREHPRVRGLIGFHASSSATDELLSAVATAREQAGTGVLFHLAESEDDLAATYAEHSLRIVPRLDHFGLLGQRSVAALARAVDRSESARLSQTETFVAISPVLEWVGEPGGGGFEALLTHPNRIGLGTAGTASLWEQLHAAFGRAMQVARGGRLADPDGLVTQFLVSSPAELCSLLFGAPSGLVEAGAVADLVVYDRLPADVGEGAESPHGWVELSCAPVAWNIVGGRVTVREGQLVGHDFIELAREAAKVLGQHR